MTSLKDPGARKNYEWIRGRIGRQWELWVNAAKNWDKKQPPTNTRHRKKV